VQGRKSLSYFLISSFLFSSFLVPYTSGMEGAESKSNVNGQKESKESFDSSNFSGVTEETIYSFHELKSLNEYILDNKNSIKEDEFIGILLMVCDIVESRLDKGDNCDYLSGQSIMICCDEKHECYKIMLEKKSDSENKIDFDQYVSILRMIMMMKHLVLGYHYWRKKGNEEYYKLKYPSDEKTCGVFKNKFPRLENILKEMYFGKLYNRSNRKYAIWKTNNKAVTLGALRYALKRCLILK